MRRLNAKLQGIFWLIYLFSLNCFIYVFSCFCLFFLVQLLQLRVVFYSWTVIVFHTEDWSSLFVFCFFCFTSKINWRIKKRESTYVVNYNASERSFHFRGNWLIHRCLQTFYRAGIRDRSSSKCASNFCYIREKYLFSLFLAQCLIFPLCTEMMNMDFWCFI